MKTVKETAAALRCCGNSECDCKSCSYIADDSCIDKLRYESADLLEYLEDKCNAAIAGQETLGKRIAELEEQNRILAHNADEAFQEGLNENRALFVKEIRELIEQAICDNTYPGADKDGNAVMIWKARTGYDAVKAVIESEAERKSEICAVVFGLPIKIGGKVYTVIFDDEDAEGWFICEDTVTDISKKGVWCSGMLPPQDDCSVLYEWDEFGKEVFADYDEAKREVEKKKCRT